MTEKAFLIAPYESWVNPQTGVMYPDKIQLIQTLIDYLENRGYEVLNSHRREEWGKKWMEPEESTPLNFQDTKDADVIVAIPGNPASGGTHWEMGLTAAFQKRMILLLERGKKYSNVIIGAGAVGPVDYVWFDRIEEIIESEEALKSLDDLL